MRLEEAVIPSESARNRAEQAYAEIIAGLTALRASFIEVAGEVGQGLRLRPGGEASVPGYHAAPALDRMYPLTFLPALSVV